ncbi:nickel pincer cofactor biosynthesis protein LarB [Planctomicrobium sp. SH668]|uniref:nickel pincer cofactor biosynthesis protein LarB n=1 Tax=Planctomicrobium sp. SH668 TaxID=3448126 RepID=UPI003F5C8447
MSDPTQPLHSVRVDLERQARCGYPEVIYAPGKTDESLLLGVQTLLEANQNVLVTRCTSAQATLLSTAHSQLISNPRAKTIRWNPPETVEGRVVVVSAGTSDLPVAEEAVETLRWMNVDVELLMDVGVAGPQRFLQEKHRLDSAQAIVVVAGMEGALPSVVGGWVSCPVFAVPTSVGYGTAFGGITALLGMLNSCASNVAVVNIDGGFKGGYLAGMVARQSRLKS